MSRVFTATETALGRKVVVKVLPPEMAAGVNVERFRREIQMAAGLQHPHIVPLLAAGQAGDLFYFTMPLVEGESLRARLAREGELPVTATVRILRDVAEALAYAHAHGVVHRDIKPDNVLISGQHAMVTDFGVAKAVSDASGESRLTSLGLALGTPAYMAPEQAAADPHVDHRADLYALGAMAYEMLCGRPPFAGMGAQQVLAAHVTMTPAPCTAHRSSVPPALDALVMRLLAKKPADRVQRADDLVATLESMATPGAGTTPTGAAPALTSDARAAIRRAHPVRVAVLYLCGAVAMLAVVYGLVLKLGLPWWVLGVAVVLLAIGLPVMLTTGRIERQRVIARATGEYAIPPHSPIQWVTWRRAWLGGASAFAALAIAAAVYTAMRLLGIGPVGTLVASGVMADKQSILLADFENRSRDTTLGPTLTEAFRVDLSQSPTVRLVDPSTISATLTRMQRTDRPSLTVALARDVAAREGTKAIVAGQIDPVGRGYVLSASVLAADDGRVLTAVRESAGDDAALIPALDRLSKALRERIGESLVTIRANEPLAAVTTSSLPALRKYTEAVRLADAGQQTEAAQLLGEATSIDTGFAMAWRKRAAVLGNIGLQPEAATTAAAKAFAHRDRLPELERLHTEGFYYFNVDVDPSKAAAAYRALLNIHPDDDIALNNLGIVLQSQRQYAAAESLFTKAINLGYKGSPYENLVIDQMAMQRPATAESTASRYELSSPGNLGAKLLHSTIVASMRDYDRAERMAKANMPRFASDPDIRARNLVLLAQITAAQGRLRDSWQLAQTAMDMAAQARERNAYLGGAADIGTTLVRLNNQVDSASAYVAAALRRFPLDSLPPLDRPYLPLARFYLVAGNIDLARRMLAEYDHFVPPGLQRGDFFRHAARGDLAAATGHMAEAVAEYHAFHDDGPCQPCGSFELGELYFRSGQRDSARLYLERKVNTLGPFRVTIDAVQLGVTYQQLGELAEARGDKPAAIDWYGRLLDLWKNADPVLQPIVKDVRSRVRTLSGPG